MSRIVIKGVIRAGRIEVDEPIDLPDGSEVTITGRKYTQFVHQSRELQKRRAEGLAEANGLFQALVQRAFRGEL